MRPLSIYLHIPFCVRKCGYCDFLSSYAGEDVRKRYVNALIEEIKGCEDKFGFDRKDYSVRTVYLGGGTPSILEPDLTDRIMEAILDRFDITDTEGLEITTEANPGTVDLKKLSAYRRSGINRLSLGLQSANDDELALLGRIHDSAAFFSAYDSAMEAGFENINVDIMTAIPGQTLNTLENTLGKVTALGCRHISAYSLILEEGTPFYDRYRSGNGLPDEETERRMYHFASGYLKENGYERYEISNYAVPGYESRHNSAYWKRDDYLGLGLGASSLIDNTRYKNTVSLNVYIETPLSDTVFEEKTGLSVPEQMSEYMFLGLRMSEGVDAEEFEKRFHEDPFRIYSRQIERLCRDGLTETAGGRIWLTEKGIDYGNYVFSNFL